MCYVRYKIRGASNFKHPEEPLVHGNRPVQGGVHRGGQLWGQGRQGRCANEGRGREGDRECVWEGDREGDSEGDREGDS